MYKTAKNRASLCNKRENLRGRIVYRIDNKIGGV